MSNAAKSNLILGIGSPFGADRVGWHAIDLLRDVEFEGVALQTSDRPGARLVTLLEGFESAILIDALLANVAPGSLHRLQLDEVAFGDRRSNHGFGVADALALGRVLGTLPTRIALIGIGVAGAELPSIDAQALKSLVRTILQENSLAAN